MILQVCYCNAVRTECRSIVFSGRIFQWRGSFGLYVWMTAEKMCRCVV